MVANAAPHSLTRASTATRRTTSCGSTRFARRSRSECSFQRFALTGRRSEALLEEVAARHPRSDEIPGKELEDGLALLGEAQRGCVVALWAEPYADRWHSLAAAAMDIPAAERALVIGALRAGIGERQPTPRDLIESLENMRLYRSPHAALAVVVPPQFVWSIDEARAAGVVHRSHRKPRARMDAVEEIAYTLMSFEHVCRTRFLCERLAAELPLDGVPRACTMLASACDDVRRDLTAARAVCAALLISYVELRALHQSGQLT